MFIFRRQVGGRKSDQFLYFSNEKIDRQDVEIKSDQFLYFSNEKIDRQDVERKSDQFLYFSNNEKIDRQDQSLLYIPPFLADVTTHRVRSLGRGRYFYILKKMLIDHYVSN